MASTAQREHLVSLMRYTIGHERQWHYRQRRPMGLTTISEAVLRLLMREGHTVSADCSEGVTALCRWSGLRDPNGRGYDGFGNTDTLLAHLPHYSDPAEAWPGALVVWGNMPSHHVAMVFERGANPMLWSHGREGGPNFVRLHDEDVAQRHRPRTFLSIARL